MKSLYLLAGSLLLAALNGDVNPTGTPPSLDAVIIISKGHDWSIEELHKIGLDFLVAKGELEKKSKVEAIVHILPDDRATMCEILYLQPAGQPYWRVKIGYDGKVTGYEKRKKREG
ncbi:MAG TPA: hypothetical protein VJA21_12630 [Verrucomicrobiae bacterium]